MHVHDSGMKPIKAWVTDSTAMPPQFKNGLPKAIFDLALSWLAVYLSINNFVPQLTLKIKKKKGCQS